MYSTGTRFAGLPVEEDCAALPALAAQTARPPLRGGSVAQASPKGTSRPRNVPSRENARTVRSAKGIFRPAHVRAKNDSTIFASADANSARLYPESEKPCEVCRKAPSHSGALLQIVLEPIGLLV